MGSPLFVDLMSTVQVVQGCARRSKMEEDLYGDLDTSVDALKIKGLEVDLSTSESRRRSLEDRLATALKKEKHLRDENEQLAKNISCLFNTAKAEIARKEKWIDRLREELQASDAQIKQLGGSRR